MGVLCHQHCKHYYHLSATTAFALLFFASIFSPTQQLNFGIVGNEEDVKRGGGSEVMERVVLNRRRLGGPGSSPPTCRFKCGRCRPCKPVRVPIQPGVSVPLEYYPEAWRCKCHNKLFMP
ncbi:hypothetical protein IFM89_002279 [Coptis chinensis]|uniref:Epidermal patterning factor-like protein n=1 Tax=Coptis chinensis TaxID=261450 RepID=A0A835IJZ9_9MAGN|nr:hypothetical protein IFM89_002279 [Coptis chinensis]